MEDGAAKLNLGAVVPLLVGFELVEFELSAGALKPKGEAIEGRLTSLLPRAPLKDEEDPAGAVLAAELVGLPNPKLNLGPLDEAAAAAGAAWEMAL